MVHMIWSQRSSGSRVRVSVWCGGECCEEHGEVRCVSAMRLRKKETKFSLVILSCESALW